MVIAIFTLLSLGVTTLFTHIFISSRERLFSIDNIDHARVVATNFTNEIRIASVGNNGAYPINQADDNQIIFYSNYGQATGIIARIRYYISGNSLYKGVVVPTGSPLAYNLAGEKISAVQNNVKNAGLPIFYYYDGDFLGAASSTPLVQPINVNQIKYVKISFDIYNQATSTATSTFKVSAGSSVRNLKSNLGN